MGIIGILAYPTSRTKVVHNKESESFYRRSEKHMIFKLESDLIRPSSAFLISIFKFLMLAFIEIFIKIALELDENTQLNVT